MGNRKLYFECNSGISGDMTVAALLDLGADEKVLMEVLESLPVQGFRTKISRVQKSSIDACDFDVILDAEHENHDHDMNYLHGHDGHDHSHEEHGHHHDGEGHHHHEDHEHHHDGEGHHHHEDHEHTHGGHGHVHRNLEDVTAVISGGRMTPGARELALRIFRIVAEAEAKAHGLPVDQVHFHEVGAIDSIVDIVAAAVCLDNLGIEEVIIPSLTEGSGTIRCQHGILSVPVPAVTNIAMAHQLPMHISGIRGELVTPTGAAICAAIQNGHDLPERFTILKTGIGAGKRAYECPGVLRVMLIEDLSGKETSHVRNPECRICRMETNIDDCSGEALGFVLEELMKAGARDAFYQPVFMKKNRPGWLLTVLCMEEKREELEDLIFRHTTTIGIRRTYMERTVLEREERIVDIPEGSARVKICRHKEQVYIYPEYESVARICRETGESFQQVYQRLWNTIQTLEEQ